MMRRFNAVLSLAAILVAGSARAQTTIHVAKTGDPTIAVDVSGLAPAGADGRTFVDVLSNDLKRSGACTVARPGSAVVTGRATGEGAGVAVECRVVSRATGAVVLSRAYNAGAGEARTLAHKVADEIVQALTGRPGFAATRLLLVGNRTGSKELYVCDADGGNLRQMTRDNSVSLMPRWSPDGGSFVYTSYRSGFPDIYRVDYRGGHRERISKFPGLNSGAAFAPDGRTLAMTLSRDGNPELYTMQVTGGRFARLTETRTAGETSPSFSPDGSQIVFVSDSSGAPQLYIMGRDGSGRKRVTLSGQENVAPDWGPDGRIAYCSRRFGRYHICVLDPRTGAEEQLTQDYVDHEDPVWAPNARHIAFARTERYESSVYVLDSATRASVPLIAAKGGWFSPSWSRK